MTQDARDFLIIFKQLVADRQICNFFGRAVFQPNSPFFERPFVRQKKADRDPVFLIFFSGANATLFWVLWCRTLSRYMTPPEKFEILHRHRGSGKKIKKRDFGSAQQICSVDIYRGLRGN